MKAYARVSGAQDSRPLYLFSMGTTFVSASRRNGRQEAWDFAATQLSTPFVELHTRSNLSGDEYRIPRERLISQIGYETYCRSHRRTDESRVLTCGA